MILDEHVHKLLTTEDQLARWQRHFEIVLNVTHRVTLDTGVSPCLVSGTLLNDEEIIEAIRKLKSGKATGQDRIVAEFLKAGPPELVDWLIEIIHLIWKTDKVPQEWKDLVLIPLFKKNDCLVCDNYYGILFLSIPGKVLANVLLGRLRPVIEPSLLEEQCSFRPQKGTIDQIWVL